MKNVEIRELVENEAKNMRDDVIVTFYKKSTGITASFKAYHGINRVGAPEYAQITAKTFHRIEKPENILRKLRNDNRLYN